MSGAGRKQEYLTRIDVLLRQYSKIMFVDADNVGSKQMQRLRIELRGKATILMGKNTMMRKAIRAVSKDIPEIASLYEMIKGNVGLVFIAGDDVMEVRDIIEANKVGALAKAGSIAPVDVVVPAGNTGLEPTQTSFMQALNIATKITKGTIEILNDVELIKIGDKVGSSEAALLQKLKIKPFAYGLKIQRIYDDGFVYDVAMLDISDDDLLKAFHKAVSYVTCVSLETGYPTAPSVAHSVINNFKRLLAVAVETEYSFPQAEEIKDRINNPDAYAVAAAPAATSGSGDASKAAAKVEESEESEDDDMGFGLFD